MIPLDLMERFVREQHSQRISDATWNVIKNRVLLMLVGPAAVGKSTVMNNALTLDPEFARVSGFTTREPRPNDEPGIYRYLTQQRDIDDFAAKIDSGDIVQYAVHPTTQKIYGSEARDYPAHYCMLDTLSSVVDGLRRLPFERTMTIAMIAEPDTWENWFRARYPARSDEATKRLAEATQSIHWLISHDTDRGFSWLVNRHGDVKETAAKLIALAKTGATPDPQARVTAVALCERAARLQEDYSRHGL